MGLVMMKPFLPGKLDHKPAVFFQYPPDFGECIVRPLQMFENIVQQNSVKGVMDKRQEIGICLDTAGPFGMAIGHHRIIPVDTYGIRIAVKELTNTRSHVEDLPVKISPDRQEEKPSQEAAQTAPFPEI